MRARIELKKIIRINNDLRLRECASPQMRGIDILRRDWS